MIFMDDEYKEQREMMIEKMKASGVLRSKAIEDAFRKVKRHLFIDEKLRQGAYEDIPIPIGYFQTISQPSTIATVLELLDAKEGHNVLEVGAGCGYVSALLREIVGDEGKVTGLEQLEELAIIARENLDSADYDDVSIIQKDGSLGHDEGKYYDRILVSAACPFVPKPLIEQVEDLGMIIAPVGNIHIQQLEIIRRMEDEVMREEFPNKLFQFVPLRGKFGFKQDSF